MPQISRHRATTRGIHCHPLDPRLPRNILSGDKERSSRVHRLRSSTYPARSPARTPTLTQAAAKLALAEGAGRWVPAATRLTTFRPAKHRQAVA